MEGLERLVVVVVRDRAIAEVKRQRAADSGQHTVDLASWPRPDNKAVGHSVVLNRRLARDGPVT